MNGGRQAGNQVSRFFCVWCVMMIIMTVVAAVAVVVVVSSGIGIMNKK